MKRFKISRVKGVSSLGTRHVSWLLNFLVMTLPRSSPSRSATFWDRSWCELPLKSTMLGISGDGQRVALMRKRRGWCKRKEREEKDEATGLRLRCWRTARLGGASVAAGRGALHWRCGRAERRREIMCTAGREVASSHWTRRQSHRNSPSCCRRRRLASSSTHTGRPFSCLDICTATSNWDTP